MKEKAFFDNLNPDQKERSAYIEGREDLFDTEILEIEKENSKDTENSVVVISRDPGSANALAPVVELMQKEAGMGVTLMTDGKAKEIFKKQFETSNITPEGNILKAAETMEGVKAGLIDASQNTGLEMFFSATFDEVPTVLVADHYFGSSLKYIEKLKERNLPLPKKICVMDEVAKKIIVDKMPELEGLIEVTGQPAFDKFATEDTEKISAEVKEKLGIKNSEKLVTFMATLSDKPELIKRLAQELSRNKGIKFAFRKHPRDNTPMEEYEKVFEDSGLDYMDTTEMSTDSIGAASDLIIATTSTEGISSIYRRKPTISIVDKRFVEQNVPSVELGASMGLDEIENLSESVDNLLDSESQESKALLENMEKHYKADGKNAQRVLDVLKGVLNSNT